MACSTGYHRSIQQKMDELEKRDAIDRVAIDRVDGTSMLDRLRQIPPETGKFLALLAASSPKGAWIEIGTSAGYSTLWLALACRERGQTLTTFEILAAKSEMAAQTIAAAEWTTSSDWSQVTSSPMWTPSEILASASSTLRRSRAPGTSRGTICS